MTPRALAALHRIVARGGGLTLTNADAKHLLRIVKAALRIADAMTVIGDERSDYREEGRAQDIYSASSHELQRAVSAARRAKACEGRIA